MLKTFRRQWVNKALSSVRRVIFHGEVGVWRRESGTEGALSKKEVCWYLQNTIRIVT